VLPQQDVLRKLQMPATGALIMNIKVYT